MENLDEQILEALQAGVKWSEIAEQFHVGNNRISRIAKENGIVKPQRQKTVRETLATLDNRVVPPAFTYADIQQMMEVADCLKHPSVYPKGRVKQLYTWILTFLIPTMNEAIKR